MMGINEDNAEAWIWIVGMICVTIVIVTIFIVATLR
jgi:hypothetical protein